MSLKDAVDEIALVETAIAPLVAAAPILFALVVVALELDLVLSPGLPSEAVLLVIQPFTFVDGALVVDEASVAICHAVLQLALVDRPARLNHAAETLHRVVHKLTLVLGAIGPDQDSKTVPDPAPVNVAPREHQQTLFEHRKRWLPRGQRRSDLPLALVLYGGVLSV